MKRVIKTFTSIVSEPHEPVQSELTALDKELEKQTVQLREWQMQELLKLRQELHALEREKQYAHLKQVRSHVHICVRCMTVKIHRCIPLYKITFVHFNLFLLLVI